MEDKLHDTPQVLEQKSKIKNSDSAKIADKDNSSQTNENDENFYWERYATRRKIEIKPGYGLQGLL